MDDNQNDQPFEMTSQEPTDIGDNTPVVFDEGSQTPATASPAQGPDSNRTVWFVIGGIAIVGCCVAFVFIYFFVQMMGPIVGSSFDAYPTSSPIRPEVLTATQRAEDFYLSPPEARATASSALETWPSIYEETFTTNKSGWDTGEDDTERATITRSLSEGKYVWDATAKSGFVGWVNPPAEHVMKDFVVSVECNVAGPKAAEYGIIFRKNSAGDYYIFRLDTFGRYQLSLRHNDEWSVIIPWTESALIQPGQPNSITVVGQGAQFMFFINHTYAAQAYDTTVTVGYATLAISLDAGQQAVFAFDNFVVRSPSIVPTLSPDSLTATQSAWIPPARSPVLASAKEALQANDLDLYENLRSRVIHLPEEPRVNQPGDVYVFDVDLAEIEPMLWTYGWCAASAETLRDNLEHMKVEFFVNGALVPDDRVAKNDYQGRTSSGPGECRSFIALINEWPRGSHQLEIRVTMLDVLHDGWNRYPAGTHVFKYLVNVP